MDKFNEVLGFLYKKNLVALAIVFFVTFVFFFGGATRIKPIFDTTMDLKAQNEANAEKLSRLKDQLKAEQNKSKMEKGKVNKVPITIYKASNPNIPIESSSIDLVTSVIKTLERTHNTIVDISYKINDAQNPSVPANVTVIQLNMTLTGTYTSFQDFLFELYDDAYISTIKFIKMIPMQENKNTLEVDTEIWLYLAK